MKSLKELFQFLNRKEKIRFFIQILTLILSSVLEVAGIGIIPGFLIYVSDAGREQEIITWLSRFFNVTLDSNGVLFTGLGVILVFFITKNIVLVFLQNSNNRYIQTLQKRMENELFKIYMLSRYEFFLTNNSAKIISNLNAEIKTIIAGVINPFFKMSLNVIMCVLIVIALLIAQPLMTMLISFVLVITVVIFFRVVRRRIQEHGKALKVGRVEMLKWSTQAIGSIKEIKTLRKESYFMKKFYEVSDKLYHLSTNYLAVINVSKPLIETVAIFCLMAIIVYCNYFKMPYEVMTSILILFGASFLRLMPAFQSLANNLSTLKYSIPSLHEVMQDITQLRSELQPEILSGNAKTVEFKNDIELKRIFFNYTGVKDSVLNGIDLKISKGQMIGFVGKTGCGKTTLVDIILGLLTPSSGDFIVDGEKVDLKTHRWKHPMGYVPQNLYLIDDSILANITLGVEADKIDMEKVEKVVKIAQLHQFLSELPKGIKTPAGDRGVKLSGGQRQRIGIARALYHAPDIIVMDEATSALDSDTERLVIEAITDFSKERTVIMIAHRLDTLKYCDRIFMLQGGRVVEEVTFAQLKSKEKIFE